MRIDNISFHGKIRKLLTWITLLSRPVCPVFIISLTSILVSSCVLPVHIGYFQKGCFLTLSSMYSK